MTSRASDPGLTWPVLGHRSWLEDPDTLLLVEDDSGDIVLVEELLADSGLRAKLLSARSLAEARTILDRPDPPGCILLDLDLPDASGLEAVTRILEAAPAAAVVVLTGLAQEEAGLAAVAAGAQDYLVKGQMARDAFGRAIRYAAQRRKVELASAALRISELRAEENARLERGLLPTPLLTSDDFQMVARYLPGREQALLGGDFYDVVETSYGAVHAVIGDVAGHGPAEAAIGVCLRVGWRSLVLAGLPPLPMMALLERLLEAERQDEQVFATLTHVTFNPDRRSATIVRAGHPGLLLRSPGSVRLIEGRCGPALGLAPGQNWREDHLRLESGTQLVLFTDGLFEIRVGPGSERLGEEGLAAIARDLVTLPAAPFADALISRAEAASEHFGGLPDDVAVLHLGWKAHG